MKSFYPIAILIAVFIFAPIQAQELKMGYTNVDYILSFMPETQAAQVQLNNYESQLNAELQTQVNEFQTKLQEYQEGASMMLDAVRVQRETELQQMQENIVQFEQNIQSSIQVRQFELFQPLYNQVQDAIDAVAAAEGYLVIFRSESLLYADESILEEVSNKVFTQLGIEPPATEEATTDQ